ncbi:hypothetical protein [Psychrobacter immobilis]|uniref:hypothetical protein n=1 Tax=Psychrobacter immobilis TaxID=498 RepID=UPI00191A6A89|nr:hypothetical protein [Psychrobacter immobilis]
MVTSRGSVLVSCAVAYDKSASSQRSQLCRCVHAERQYSDGNKDADGLPIWAADDSS